MTTRAEKTRLLAELKERVRRIEGIGGADGRAVAPLGVPDLDAALPGGGLALGAVHEVLGMDRRLDTGAATGFAAVLLGRLAAGRGPLFWVTRGRDLYAPGLAALGIEPGRLILVQAESDADALWALEEALRCPSVGAVLGEAAELDMTASRRLQLAAESSGVPGVVLRLGPRRLEANACVTRWRLEAVAAGAADVAVGGRERGQGAVLGGGDLADRLDARWADGLHARWRAALLRCRGGRPGDWLLTWLGTRLEGRAATAEPARRVAAAGEGLAAERVVQLRVGNVR